MQRYECLKKKKKPEPFLTGFLINDSINPKFRVKRKEQKSSAKQSIPKISGSISNKNQSQKNKSDNNLLDMQNQQNDNNNNIQVKDVNDIFDLFGSSVKISDNNKTNVNKNNNNNNLNKSANFDDKMNNLNSNKNELNPNNMIDLVTNLTQSQKAKHRENIIDLSQLGNSSVNAHNAPNANNMGINDVKISNEPQQSKKIVDLEELLKSAYSNNNNNMQRNPQADNDFMNNVN